MNIMRRNLCIKSICILLVICVFANSNINAYASEKNIANISSIPQELINLSRIGSEDLKSVFEEMTPEAQSLFLNYMMTSDVKMLQLHQKYVDNNVRLNTKTINTQRSMQSFAVRSVTSLSDQLKILSYQLGLIGLSESVKYALMSAGSSILAALADGPLLVGDIVAIIVAAGCAVVLIANWDSVSSNWSKIIKAFQIAFKGDITSSSMKSAFTKAEPNFSNPYLVMQQVASTIRNAPVTKSFSKHIDTALTLKFVKQKNAVRIYYSPITKKALFVYEIPNGIRANLNRDFYEHSQWQLTNYDISGAKLFVIFAMDTHTLIHAHLRLFRDDTESMRYGNKMSWQIKPNMCYSPIYEIGGGTTWLSGDITN